MITNLFYEDDEEIEFEEEFRQAVNTVFQDKYGNVNGMGKFMADLILYGAPAAVTGYTIGPYMGTSTLTPIPIANAITSPAYKKASEGFKTFAFELLGAPVSFLNRFFQGYDHMREGDFMKATAKFTPGLFSNVFTGLDMILNLSLIHI